MSFLINFLVLILILGLIVGVFIYAIRAMPFIPTPFKNAAVAVVCLIVVLALLGVLTGQVAIPALGRSFR